MEIIGKNWATKNNNLFVLVLITMIDIKKLLPIPIAILRVFSPLDWPAITLQTFISIRVFLIPQQQQQNYSPESQ